MFAYFVAVQDKMSFLAKMFLFMNPCAKPTPVDGDEDDHGNGTPNTKEAVKGLSLQIKDLALKLSWKKIKAGNPKSIKYDTVSEEGVPYGYIGGGSASSTPALDYTNPNQSPIGNTTPGGRQPQPPAGSVAMVDVTGSNKWIAKMEPGAHITVVSLPTGGNDLKRIRFCRDMFDKPRAQRLWAENYDRIRELHNIHNLNQHVFNTPARSNDDEIKDLALKLSGKKIKGGTSESIKYDTVSEGGFHTATLVVEAQVQPLLWTTQTPINPQLVTPPLEGVNLNHQLVV
ncbi:protein BREVIS RADIX-like [Gastrolobium bilobum]|uniref:protein BREVIS RADIX-like n=1 Tax=Gastrolobium bilobum TaxID=150636 RepID=UPI002AAF571B|nr:protein BREVIS RADIX-like [Gastrolobium bilobum]